MERRLLLLLRSRPVPILKRLRTRILGQQELLLHQHLMQDSMRLVRHPIFQRSSSDKPNRFGTRLRTQMSHLVIVEDCIYTTNRS